MTTTSLSKADGKKSVPKKGASANRKLKNSLKSTTVKERKLILAKKTILTPGSIRVEKCNVMNDLREKNYYVVDFKNLIPDAFTQVSLFPNFIDKLEELENKEIIKWYPLVVFGDGK